MLPAFLHARPALWTAAMAGLLGALLVPTVARAETAPCTVSGSAFTDADRDGVRDAGEAPRAGDVLYLFDATGAYVTGATTDGAGAYSFPALACGTYTVEYGAQTWWAIRESLVPTTGSIRPRQTLSGTATADFGWRAVQRSTTAGAPLSSLTGPQGLRVESYNDAVSARELYDAVTAGNVGAEGPDVTVRFDLGGSSVTSTSSGATGGVYDRFSATTYVSWLSWLDSGAVTLSHEYGHAWSLYRAYLVQQDPSLAGYLRARGLTGDPRLGSSYSWSASELVAEDYRQLLGGAAVAAAQQTNRDVPPAGSVPGLRDYLLGAFTGAAPAASPSASASPSAAASPYPSPSAAPAPSPSTVSPIPASSPSPVTSTGKSRPCRKGC